MNYVFKTRLCPGRHSRELKSQFRGSWVVELYLIPHCLLHRAEDAQPALGFAKVVVK